MRYLILGIITLSLVSCAPTQRGNDGKMPTYDYAVNMEVEWIRNGEPIEFEGELWYPRDDVETLLDSEVYLLGEHKGTQKVDVLTTDRRSNRKRDKKAVGALALQRQP